MSKRCENCGNILSDADRFCPVCSIPVAAPEDNETSVSNDFDGFVRSSNPSVKRQHYVTLSTVIMVLLAIAALIVILSSFIGKSALCSKPMKYSDDLGYYNYNDTVYYNQNGSWYEYDPALGWILADPSDDFLDHSDNYYEGKFNSEGSDVSDFRDSEFYDPNAGLVERDDSGKNDNGGQNYNEYKNNDSDMDGDW